jgi:hypothetical protein
VPYGRDLEIWASVRDAMTWIWGYGHVTWSEVRWMMEEAPLLLFGICEFRFSFPLSAMVQPMRSTFRLKSTHTDALIPPQSCNSATLNAIGAACASPRRSFTSTSRASLSRFVPLTKL